MSLRGLSQAKLRVPEAFAYLTGPYVAHKVRAANEHLLRALVASLSSSAVPD